MEESRKIEILNSLKIFFRNHQRYEMAAYIRSITKSITSAFGCVDVGGNENYYLSETIPDPSITNKEEYEFVISLIDEYPIKGHFINQNDSWTTDQYKNLVNTKRIKRILVLNRIGI